MHVLNVEVVSLEYIVVICDACQIVYTVEDNLINVSVVEVCRPALIKGQV